MLTDTSTPPTGPQATLVEGGVVTCPDPGARAAQPFDLVLVPSEPNQSPWLQGSGAVAADFDGDGALEWVALGVDGARVWTGVGAGAPVEVTGQVLPAVDLSEATGGSAADYDGDGDLDLFVTRYGPPNALLRNEGDGTFVDVTSGAGAGGPADRHTMSSAWADFDRDGDLDLFVGNFAPVYDEEGPEIPGEPDQLLVNQGRGTFVEAMGAVPQEADDGWTYVGSWIDGDGDGWPDLYSIHGRGQVNPSVWIWNRAGVLTPDDGRAGLNTTENGMGLGIGDLNGDDIPDFAIPATRDIPVFESHNGLWVDVSLSLHVVMDRDRDQLVGWGAELVDLDADGDLDLPVAFGHVVGNNPNRQPDALFERGPDGTFADRAPQWGVADEGAARGFVAADFDGDGLPDLGKRFLEGDSRVYLSRCGENHWLTVRLDQPGANRRAIGARIATTAGGQRRVRWMFAGGTSLASGGPPEVYVGLGGATTADLEVTWPDGERSVFSGVGADQVVTVRRVP